MSGNPIIFDEPIDGGGGLGGPVRRRRRGDRTVDQIIADEGVDESVSAMGMPPDISVEAQERALAALQTPVATVPEDGTPGRAASVMADARGAVPVSPPPMIAERGGAVPRMTTPMASPPPVTPPVPPVSTPPQPMPARTPPREETPPVEASSPPPVTSPPADAGPPPRLSQRPADATRSAALMSPEELRRKPARPPPTTMDAGLPSEDDIRGAEASDTVMRWLHNLGSGIRAAGATIAGTSPGSVEPLESRAPQLRQERAQGLSRARSDKSEALDRERQAQSDSRAERELEVESEGQRLEGAHRERQDRIAELRAESDARRADATIALSGARTGRERLLAAQALEDEEPDSDRARQEMAVYASARRARDIAAGREPRSVEEYAAEVEGLGARAIREATAAQGTLSQGSRGRARGEGGGGGSAASRPALIEEARRLGVPSPEAYPTADLRREILQRTRAGRGSEGEEILPGVRAGIGLDRGEGRSIRHEFAQSAAQYASLDEVDAIASEFGSSAVVSPEAAARMAGPLTRLRAMVARLQNTGVINPSEAPAIEAMIPNPTDLRQMTFGTLRARLQSFRQEVEGAIQAELRARGVDDEGVDTAMGLLHGGGRREARSETSEARSDTRRYRVSRGGQASERPLTEAEARQLTAAGFEVSALSGP